MKTSLRLISLMFVFILVSSQVGPASASDSGIHETSHVPAVSKATGDYPNVNNSVPCNIIDASWVLEPANTPRDLFEAYIELTILDGTIKFSQDSAGRAVGAVSDSVMLHELAKSILVNQPVETWIIYGHGDRPDQIPENHWRITVPKRIVLLNFFTDLFMDPLAKVKYLLSPSKLLYLRCEPPVKAAPPPQQRVSETLEIFPGGSFPQETGVCFDRSYDVNYEGGDIWLAGDNTGQAKWALDDALALSISHPDGSVANLNFISNTLDQSPINLKDSFASGTNHVRVQVSSTVPPLCGGGHLWLKWDGGLSLPSEELYSIIEHLSIVEPAPSAQLKYPIYVPGWMKWIQTTLRKGSNATITLIAPDGTVYSPSSPSVHYTDTSGAAVHTLNLDPAQEGVWQVVIDVIAVDPDSVFLLDVTGKQGDVPSTDDIAPVTSLHFDGTKGLNGWFTSPVTVTLSAEDNPGGSGVKGIEWRLADGDWQPYTGPFSFDQEGISYLEARSYDHAGNYESVPVGKFLAIDTIPPVVEVSVDQTAYTRVQPFVVHFSGFDPMPGSGLASLTAVFNGQSVIDGQSVDMFWWNLGQYTLTATGEDYAGWVTTESTSIQLVATIKSLQQTVRRLCQEGYITKAGICKSLVSKLNSALAAQKRGQKKTAVNILFAFQQQIKAQTNKSIKPEARALLLMDSNYVIVNLGGKVTKK